MSWKCSTIIWIYTSSSQGIVELDIDIVERVRCGRAVRSCAVCLSVLSVCLSALRHLSVSLKPLSSCWAASSSIHLMSYSNTATHAVHYVQHIIPLPYILCRSDAYIKTQDSARERLENNLGYSIPSNMSPKFNSLRTQHIVVRLNSTCTTEPVYNSTLII